MQVHMYLMWSRTYVVALLDGAHAELTHLSLAESTMCVQIIVGRTIAIAHDEGPTIFMHVHVHYGSYPCPIYVLRTSLSLLISFSCPT